MFVTATQPVQHRLVAQQLQSGQGGHHFAVFDGSGFAYGAGWSIGDFAGLDGEHRRAAGVPDAAYCCAPVGRGGGVYCVGCRGDFLRNLAGE